MKNADRIEEYLMRERSTDGKDEMNLAEFPLCALSRRLRPDQKTLHFEDRLKDRASNQWITRRLTITGSDLFGLPTALDDEVLLGLIQLTRQCDFAFRKVPFTRHELLRLLDWPDDSKNYQRLEASLNRWTGVTLYYQKAWWNKARKCWVDEKFHVLDNVWLCHRGEPPPDIGLEDTSATTSAFVWNEVIFRSFQAGNLKSIDFEFFKSLKSTVAKRLYRFLDKRFWNRSRCEFRLREFACQKLGMSQSYDAANLKRKLLPGIRELETRGFLAALPERDRFRKLRAGNWMVRFEEAKGGMLSDGIPDTRKAGESSLAQALVARGVAAGAAVEVTESISAETIQAKIKIFDWLVRRRDPRISRNPAGFLISSIRNEYASPRDFPAQPESPRRESAQAPSHHEAANRQTPSENNENAESRKRRQISRQFWQSLSPEEKADAQSEAIATARPLERKLLESGGAFAGPALTTILDAYALKAIRARSRKAG